MTVVLDLKTFISYDLSDKQSGGGGGSWDFVTGARNKWADNKTESFAKIFSRGSETINLPISNILIPIFGLQSRAAIAMQGKVEECKQNYQGS